MSYVVADPEMMTAAASDLAKIGSIISAATAAAAPSTTVMVAATGGADRYETRDRDWARPVQPVGRLLKLVQTCLSQVR